MLAFEGLDLLVAEGYYEVHLKIAVFRHETKRISFFRGCDGGGPFCPMTDLEVRRVLLTISLEVSSYKFRIQNKALTHSN